MSFSPSQKVNLSSRPTHYIPFGQWPKSAKGKTLDGGSLFSPRVKAGTYTVKLTKGNETFETKISTIYDPQSPFTLKEREIQEQVTQDLFNFTEDLAYLVYQINTWDAAVEEFSKAQSKPAKYILSINNGLDAIREACVVTKGDNYVGTAEPKLREKLGDIYSTIGSYYGAPSSSQLENVAALKTEYNKQAALFEKNKIRRFEKVRSRVGESRKAGSGGEDQGRFLEGRVILFN